MDWCGFGGGSLFASINDGTPPEGIYPDGWDLYSDMDVKLEYKKVGVNVALDWVWYGKVGAFEGRVIEYHQGCVLTDANAPLGIALSAEWATMTITKASLTR